MITKVFVLVITLSGLAFTFVTIVQLMLFLSSFSDKREVNNSSIYSDVAGDEASTAVLSSIVDISLLICFIIQHSFSSAPLSKLLVYSNIRYMQRILYNILTAAVLQILMIYWRPIPYYVLWSITLEQSPMFKLMFQLLHSLSWLSLYIMCISLDITELLGIKWVYYNLISGNEFSEPLTSQSQQSFSRYKSRYKSQQMLHLQNSMKHPGFLCLLVILWVYPVMRLDRLFIAVIWTVYMALAWHVDENDINYIIEQRSKKFAS
ncbi:nurim homolog [Lycorma delicatula]|uniref:nurim homolog n=1 Tax=Lycorma delicatula TaxID=130591 RepID=UPI003F50F44D